MMWEHRTCVRKIIKVCVGQAHWNKELKRIIEENTGEVWWYPIAAQSAGSKEINEATNMKFYSLCINELYWFVHRLSTLHNIWCPALPHAQPYTLMLHIWYGQDQSWNPTSPTCATPDNQASSMAGTWEQ